MTPIASKVLEYFPCEWIYECIKDKVDPNQFGGIKGSSTTLALIHLVNYIAKETDKRNMYARVLLCDFSKAFDLVDHQLVLQKLSDVDVPPFLVKWAASFLLNRMQQVKIGSHVSTPVLLNAGCTQGTLFGPLAFVAHINDLYFPDPAFGIKYVDDSSAAHSSKTPGDETIQESADYMNDWSIENHMKNNPKKTNDMIFCFALSEPIFTPNLHK